MKTWDLDVTELSLLLYLEDCSVNKGGRISHAHMNETDRRILDEWSEDGFVQTGRICMEDGAGNWVLLSEEAWVVAARERRERACRVWNSRKWRSIAELRGADMLEAPFIRVTTVTNERAGFCDSAQRDYEQFVDSLGDRVTAVKAEDIEVFSAETGKAYEALMNREGETA